MGEVVGGMIASAVGDQISKKLGEFLSEEISLLWGFKDDVEGLQEKMEDLQAVLRDADDSLRRGERNGEAVGRWLIKFKSVADDVEDVLDELDANKLINKTHSKLKLFFSRDNQLLQRMNIAHNMKNVRQQIGKITKEGQELNLARPGARAEGSRNNETIAAISDESIGTEMVGRVTEKEKIIRLVLTSEATDDISIIPIVGLGGLGKTTLARSVFADKLVNIFDVQAWVYVSEKFDLHKIGSAIMRSINPSVNLEGCNLQFLIENLEKGLSGRRYLIVLDDLWEEDGDELERLKQMLQHGCRGSRIIVTTRTQSVVKKLYTGFLANKRKICPVPETDQINLDDLSADDCWELMKRRAFGPHDDQSGLEDIGRQIAKKCGGLPLVANALGQVMSELKTVHAWEEIRDTKIDLGSLDQKGILERLMLSYYFMKLDFKMCFTYLVVFPKGFVIGSNRLIQQWIALGYIHTENNGHRCINYLMGMSFLQIAISAWHNAEVPHKIELEPVWLHVEGVPHTVRHFLGLWAVGTLMGKTLDVDLLSLRRRGVVRILVAMFDSKLLNCKRDEKGPYVLSDVVVKLKGYEFRFRRETADYVPEPDFVPFVWKKREDGTDEDGANGKGHDDAMDTSDTFASSSGGVPPQTHAVNSRGPPPGGSRSVVRAIAVTPFNPSPTTPKAAEVVAKLRQVYPWLEGRSPQSVVAPVVESMQVEGSEAVLQPTVSVSVRPCSPARGRVHTMKRTIPAPTVISATPVFSEVARCSPVPFSAPGPDSSVVLPTTSCNSPASFVAGPSSASGQLGVLDADAVGGDGPGAAACWSDAAASHLGVADMQDPDPSSPHPGLAADAGSPREASPILFRGGSSSALTSPGALPSAITPRRSSRHEVGSDGATATDEDAMSRAMRRKASANLDSPGTLPLYGVAPFLVVTAAATGPRPFYGGFYTVGGYSERLYYPTWVAA